MNKQQLRLVFVVIALVVAGVVALLVTGGEDNPGVVQEQTGDITEREGGDAPTDTALADITGAEVRREGDTLIFEAELSDEIPRKIKKGSFDLRWDVHVQGTGIFIVSGNLDIGPNVSVVGLENNYGSSTLDESMPGEMEIDGNVWIIRLRPDDIPDWPEEFQWKLTTTLDGKAGDPNSGLAEDTAPDFGMGEVISV